MEEIRSAFFFDLIRCQNDADALLLEEFYVDFDARCQLRKNEKQRLWLDHEHALAWYLRNGFTVPRVLKLLDPSLLGDFYERPSRRWFPLDDAAKLYPLSMERGRMSVFRLSATLDAPVVPELLQMALNYCVKRFPTYATTLKKGVFWHYLDATTRRYCIEPEHHVPCQPIKISHSGAQSFRVLYHRSTISVEFFHVLCDALGGMHFLTALVVEYLRLTGVEIPRDDRIPDIQEPAPAAELENAFATVAKAFDDQPRRLAAPKPAVQLGGSLAHTRPCRILHFRMNAAALKRTAAEHETTVTGYMLALLFIAAKRASSEQQGYLNIQVPVDLRKFYPSPTLRNFVLPSSIGLPLERITMPAAICPLIDEELRRKTSKAAMDHALAATARLIDMVKFIPLRIKQPVFQRGYVLLSDRLYSSILSNLGVIHLPEALTAHVHNIDAVIGPSITQRARCMLVTYAGTATLSITKTTPDPTFENTLHALIRAAGIDVFVEGSPLYED